MLEEGIKWCHPSCPSFHLQLQWDKTYIFSCYGVLLAVMPQGMDIGSNVKCWKAGAAKETSSGSQEAVEMMLADF